MKKFLGNLTVGGLAMQILRYIQEHELMTRASAIAFVAMGAGVPLLLLLFTVCVLLLPDLTGHASGSVTYITADQFRAMLREFMPPEVFQVVADQIARIQQHQPYELLSLSLVFTVWFASSLNAEIISALNRIYGFEETRAWWRLRLQALFMTFVQVFVLFAGVVAFLDGPMILDWLGITELNAYVAVGIKWITVFTVLIGSFAFTFHMGPNSAQQKQWVTPGSIFGAFAFIFCSIGFRIFVEEFGRYGKVYGSLGGVMALLFWLWLASLVLLVAAEINRIVDYAAQNRKLPRTRDGQCGAHLAEGSVVSPTVVQPNGADAVETDRDRAEPCGEPKVTQQAVPDIDATNGDVIVGGATDRDVTDPDVAANLPSEVAPPQQRQDTADASPPLQPAEPVPAEKTEK